MRKVKVKITKSETIRRWLEKHPKGCYADFVKAYPKLGVSRSLFAHVCNSRRTLKKLTPKYRGQAIEAVKIRKTKAAS